MRPLRHHGRAVPSNRVSHIAADSRTRSNRNRHVKTVADLEVWPALTERCPSLRRDSRRRWGTLTPHEMLCHLGDAAEMVLRIRPRTEPVAARPRPVIKRLGLWTPIPWPHGWQTNPAHDPRIAGTRPTDFAADLQRALAGIHGIATARPETIE